MKSFIWAGALMCMTSASMAEECPMLQRAVGVVQGQRNLAMDNVAVEKSRADSLAEELAKAQSRIRELEAKDAAK